MNKFVRIITSFDLFPPIFQLPLIDHQSIPSKRISGAVASSLIYFTGFSYLLYLLIEYAMGDRLPTVCISQIHYEKTNEFIIPRQIYQLQMKSINNKDGNYYLNSSIFTQHDHLVINNQPSEELSIEQNFCQQDSIIEQKRIFNSSGCVNLKKQQILKNNPTDSNQDILFLSYYKHCQYDQENNTDCLNAVQESSLHPLWSLKVFYSIINYQTGQQQVVSRDFYQSYTSDKTLDITLKIKKTTVRVDSGLFMPDISEYEIISGVDVVVQNREQGHWLDGSLILAQTLIQLDSVQEIINISYQRLPDVLAGFQSTLSFLILFGLLLQEFNTKLLEINLLDQLTKIFFPEFRKLKIIRNFQNKITKIYQNGSEIQNIKNIVNFQKRIEDTLQNKIAYLNIVRSISRLEIAFTMIFGQDFLVSLDDLGYQIPISEEEELSEIEISEEKQLLIFSEKQFERISKFQEENINIIDSNVSHSIQEQIILRQLSNGLQFKLKKLLQNQSHSLQLKKKENQMVRKVTPEINNNNTEFINLNDTNKDNIIQLDKII